MSAWPKDLKVGDKITIVKIVRPIVQGLEPEATYTVTGVLWENPIGTKAPYLGEFTIGTWRAQGYTFKKRY